MTNKRYFTVGLIMLLALSSCDRYDGEVTIPSYIKIDGIDIVDNSNDSWSALKGFFTNDIDAVNIVVWSKGDTAETNLGMHQLPCTLPVLKNGKVDRITISPIVKQNGIAGSRINYAYYKDIVLNDVILCADSVTDFGRLSTTYYDKSSKIISVKWEEWFEPGASFVKLDPDTLVHITSDNAILCDSNDHGCGVVHLPAVAKTYNFWSDTTFYVNVNEIDYLYLEMDYWSDFDFGVGFNNPVTNGGNNLIYYAMTVYGKPEQGWRKIYINLGKLWSYYNHYTNLRLYFSVFNPDGKEGNLYIDNMKIVAR